jgi:hypothetical protein
MIKNRKKDGLNQVGKREQTYKLLKSIKEDLTILYKDIRKGLIED